MQSFDLFVFCLFVFAHTQLQGEQVYLPVVNVHKISGSLIKEHDFTISIHHCLVELALLCDLSNAVGWRYSSDRCEKAGFAAVGASYQTWNLTNI